MVLRSYCDNCNKDITHEKVYAVNLELDEYGTNFIFCKDCYERAYDIICTIVPKQIWMGSPDFPEEES